MLCAVVLSLLAVSACRPPVTGDSPASSQIEEAKDVTAAALEDISADLEDLDPKERRARLIEMAEDEGGVLDAYGSTNLEEAGPIIDAFEDATGITVNYYRASSEDVNLRLGEEARAGYLGADLVVNNGPQMILLDDDGLLAQIDTPVSDPVTPEGVNDTWIWWYINTFAPAWNTDLVESNEAPTSWEEVLESSEGGLAVEAGDVDWFATLVTDYFGAEKGMSEEDAVELFRSAMDSARVVDGHTLMTELLAAGEFSVAASPYLHRIRQLQGDGAPLEWEPAVEPLIARPNGVAIHAAAEHPAAAQLFLEFLLTDAQDMLLELDRQPASSDVEGGGLPTEYDFLLVDVQAVVDDFDKWADLYDDILQSAGR